MWEKKIRLFFQQKKWKVNVRKEDVNIVWGKSMSYANIPDTWNVFIVVPNF